MELDEKILEGQGLMPCLERFLPSMSSLMQDAGSVVTEHLATKAAAALHLVVLLVLSPLGSLFKGFSTNGASLQLKLDVMSIQVFDQGLRY